jgi:hypothetical protein
MGAYTVFLDVALGFGTPVLGLIAGSAGLGAVFLATSLAALSGAAFAFRLMTEGSPTDQQSRRRLT